MDGGIRLNNACCLLGGAKACCLRTRVGVGTCRRDVLVVGGGADNAQGISIGSEGPVIATRMVAPRSVRETRNPLEGVKGDLNNGV